MKEKLAALVVKFKENKKLSIIVGVVALAIIILIVALVAIFAMRPSYKTTVRQFVKACESDKKMEKFVDKYVDYRALYAVEEADEPEDFKDEYKKAKKSDYKDEDFVDDVKDTFSNFVTEDGEIKVKEIGKLKDYEDCEELSEAKVTLENEDGDEVDFKFIFYKGKMLTLTIDY